MIAVQKVVKVPLVYYGINNFHYIFPAFAISPGIQKRQLKMSSMSHPFLWRLKKIIIDKWRSIYSPSCYKWGMCKLNDIFFIWASKNAKICGIVFYVTCLLRHTLYTIPLQWATNKSQVMFQQVWRWILNQFLPLNPNSRFKKSSVCEISKYSRFRDFFANFAFLWFLRGSKKVRVGWFF